MTHNDIVTKRAKRSFALNWVPLVRTVVPADIHRPKVECKKVSVDGLEREDLMDLFQSDLGEKKSLKSLNT